MRRIGRVPPSPAPCCGETDFDLNRANIAAPDFLLRAPGGESTDADTFVRAIESIAAEIVFVRLDHLEIDLGDGAALVTGIQHAQCRVDGQVVDERRPFVDWFVRDQSGSWLVKVAVDLPPLSRL